LPGADEASGPREQSKVQQIPKEQVREDEKDYEFLQMAMEEARIAVKENSGGPFGAVLVDRSTGEVVARTHNCVVEHCDATAHAEMLAIKTACKRLNTFELNNCDMYTSCEPCPMSFAAIFLARIPRLVYGSDAEYATAVGYDPGNISDAIRGTAVHQKSDCEVKRLNHPMCAKIFSEHKEHLKVY